MGFLIKLRNKISTWFKWLLELKIISMLLLEILLITIGFTIGNYFEIFDISKVKAIDLIKETLSNYISILGIGLAILAILLSILQFSIKRLSIVKLLIEKSQFAPLFYFGSINIILGSALYLFSQDDLFIPEYYFVRGTLILNYLFIVLILFIALVFTITLRYIEYSNISSLYLSDVKNIVAQEQRNLNNENFREALETKSQELQNEIEANIDDRKFLLNNKIFDLYKYVLQINPRSILINNLRYNLIKWLVDSYKKENYTAFHNLVANWRNIYSECISSLDDSRISLFKNLPSELYELGVIKNDQHIKSFVIDTFPIRLKEEAQRRLWKHDENDKPKKDWEPYFNEIHPILFDLNELVHCVALDQNSKINIVLNELSMLEEYNEFDNEYRDLNFKIKFNRNEGDAEPILTSDEYKSYQTIDKYYKNLFAIKFGNISWLYYECFTERKSFQDLSISISYLEQSLLKYRGDALKWLIEIFSGEKEKYNWHEWVWRSEERLSGQTYSLESDEDFLALGFIIWTLKSGVALANIDSLSKDDLSKSETLIHYVTRILEFYKQKTEIWFLMFNTKDSQVINDYFIKMETFLKKLKNAKETNYLKDLVKEPISANKVAEFKEMIKAQWEKSRTLSIVFEYFNSTDFNPPEKLKFIGHGIINYQKAKFLFVEKLYNRIYGIEWGHEIGLRVNTYFLSTLFNNTAIERINIAKLTDAFNQAANFTITDLKFNVLFISNSAWYPIERDLESSGSYRPSRSEQIKKYPFEYFGVYKESLIIIPLRSNLFSEKNIIAMNLPGAIQLARRTNPEWIDNKLQLDIKEISEEGATEILLKQGKTKPFDEKSIIETMASILIEIGETLDFKILNPDLIKVYSLDS